MRRIMVLNPKGGCGKSTLAYNLASYFASINEPVTLVDFDSQSSSLDWLTCRPHSAPPIRGIRAKGDDLLLPHGQGFMIMDMPAGLHGKTLKRHIKLAQTILIPVLPSPMDIRASAKFIEELLLLGRVVREQTRIAVIANRVREQTLIYRNLARFLASLQIPFLTSLRDSQNYIRSAEKGIGIFELADSIAARDVQQWMPILQWLASSKSLPLKQGKGVTPPSLHG